MDNTKRNEQVGNFRQKARELECDESPEAFDNAFRKIVPPVKAKPKKAKSKG